MDLSLFLRGLLIGLAVAAPVGSIGVLCIRRTLAEGRSAGLLTGLGAATADALYGAIAAFGLTALSGFLVEQQAIIRLGGGLFLCYLGIRTWRAPVVGEAAQAQGRALLGAYGSSLLLTLTNPLTILSFAAIFAGSGLGTAAATYGEAMVIIAGVLRGSALWWLILSGGVSLVRGRLTPSAFRWINRLSGSVLLAFGLVALASLR